MATITGNIITVTQKSAATIPVIITDSSGSAYNVKDTDSALFTVKESTTNSNVVIQKELSDGSVDLTENDTNIPIGYYVYDVQIVGADGYTTTVIEPTSFIVSESNSLARDIDITKFLPAVTDQCRDIIAACEAENIDLETLWDSLVSVFYNQFIMLASEYGLTQWEKIFDITPAAADTWDDRRFRILTYIKGTRPYTDEKMEELLDKLCGTDGYIIERDYANYKITFKLNLGVKSQLSRAQEMLERIVPMNLDLTVTLNYNRHQDLKRKFTHEEMKAYTHKSLREDPL
jgi:hypothetical protein